MKIADIDVEYLDHMGSDLTVVNAARVSFHKEHDEFDYKTDRGLIRYLAKHNHWSPFAHCSASFRVKAPIFVARQLVKHTVGFSWNEVSRRYVDEEPEFFLPTEFRKRADNVKQGSSEELVPGIDLMHLTYTAFEGYSELLDQGVCPEQARMAVSYTHLTLPTN
jgi:thymidylate synthase (FAD)